jgi:hypothetical protein
VPPLHHEPHLAYTRTCILPEPLRPRTSNILDRKRRSEIEFDTAKHGFQSIITWPKSFSPPKPWYWLSVLSADRTCAASYAERAGSASRRGSNGAGRAPVAAAALRRTQLRSAEDEIPSLRFRKAAAGAPRAADLASAGQPHHQGFTPTVNRGFSHPCPSRSSERTAA